MVFEQPSMLMLSHHLSVFYINQLDKQQEKYETTNSVYIGSKQTNMLLSSNQYLC
jgi:hypothetical protein